MELGGEATNKEKKPGRGSEPRRDADSWSGPTSVWPEWVPRKRARGEQLEGPKGLSPLRRKPGGLAPGEQEAWKSRSRAGAAPPGRGEKGRTWTPPAGSWGRHRGRLARGGPPERPQAWPRFGEGGKKPAAVEARTGLGGVDGAAPSVHNPSVDEGRPDKRRRGGSSTFVTDLRGVGDTLSDYCSLEAVVLKQRMQVRVVFCLLL